MLGTMKNKISNVVVLLSLGIAAAAASAQDAKPGDAAAGQKKADMCIGCHGIAGYQASFPEVYKVPKIAGQNAKYIVAALNGYKKGERKHPSMRGIAGSLSEQDMADLAAYFEQLGKSGDGERLILVERECGFELFNRQAKLTGTENRSAEEGVRARRERIDHDHACGVVVSAL